MPFPRLESKTQLRHDFTPFRAHPLRTGGAVVRPGHFNQMGENNLCLPPIYGIEFALLQENCCVSYTGKMREENASLDVSCGGVRFGLRHLTLVFFLLFISAGQSYAQPLAELKPHTRTIPLNRALRVTLEVVWAGAADLYDVPQPDLSGLAQFEVTEHRVLATRQGDENRLRHELVMKPLEEGEHDLSHMQVRYFEKGEDTPTAIPLSRTTVRVTSPEKLSRNAKIAIGMVAILALTGAGGIILIHARRASREKKRRESETLMHTRADFLSRLEEARPLLIEGKTAMYLDELRRLADSDALGPHVEKGDRLRELAEDVKFGGRTASPDELNWAEKTIRAAIRKAFPAEEAEEETE